MIYYELVEKTFADRGNVVPVTKLSFEPRNYHAYISLFGYGDEIHEWLELNDSVKDYNGELYLQTLYFDIDRSDLEEARKDTLRLLKHLYNEHGASPKELELFFSGGKGFHIGIPGKLFGNFEKSAELPQHIKKLAEKLSPKSIEGIDLTIYNVNRIFRMPHSKHQDTGLFKVPLYLNELKGSVQDIKELAEYPRPEFEPTVGRNDLVVNESLQSLWKQAKHQSPRKNQTPKDSLKDGNFFKPPEKGSRNNKLFKQSAMLFDKGLDSRNVYDIINSINSAAKNPIENEDEIFTIVQSARRKTGGGDNNNNNEITKNAPKLEGDTHLVSDLVPTFLEYLSPSQRKLGLLFDEFSEDVRWKLRGKLIGVVGREGTKKSLFCQNVAYHNMRKHGARTIVSNMEMGDNALMARLIDRSFSKYRIRPSDDMERAIKEGERGWVKDRLHLLSKHYGDKLVINSRSAMTPKDYAKLIKKTEKRHGKVDMLIVDGFSMMGGKSSDRFQKQENNSRKLKEIAKAFDVCVMPIFHTNASAKKYWRKAHEHIRGSNKQKDNIDAFISLSMLVDESNTANQHDIVYQEDKGYALMYNKRGSGNTIRNIYNFDSARLRLRATEENPHKYEVNVNRL